MPNTYLADLLSSQQLQPAQRTELDKHKDEVEKCIREDFGDEPMIKIAGSVSKGTANCDSYDLDIVVYFPSSDERSLKQIYEDVAEKLSTKYSVVRKSSAIRITGLPQDAADHDYHIDVVPGRFIEGSSDVFLHVSDGDKDRLKTNLKTHIGYITGSGCQDVIRLVKLWKTHNRISLKTFILEMFVVRTLEGSPSKADLEQSFVTVMQALAAGMRMELVDPANTNNVVSESLTEADKALIANIATGTLKLIADSSSQDKWTAVFKGAVVGAMAINSPKVSPRGFTPHAPWSDGSIS